MVIGDIIQFSINFVYLILLARALGANGFGVFAGTVALISIFAPFSDLGKGNLLLMHISRNNHLFSIYWGNALLAIICCGTFFILIFLGVAEHLLVKIESWHFILFLAFAELYFNRLLELSKQVFQAFELLSIASILNICFAIFRFIAVLYFVNINSPKSLEVWSKLYLVVCFFTSLIGFLIITKKFGLPNFKVKNIFNEFRLGIYFSLGTFFKSVYANVDKIMLTRLSTLEFTGIYSIAHRIVLIMFLPIRALLDSSIARFFRAGEEGLEKTWEFALRFMPMLLGYGMLVGLGLYFLAPIILLLFGEEYTASIGAVRWLCLIPLLQSMHYLIANTLTGAGMQGIRSGIQAMIAILNVTLNLLLIPLYSWKGAIWATLISETLLGILLFSVIIWKKKTYKTRLIK